MTLFGLAPESNPASFPAPALKELKTRRLLSAAADAGERVFVYLQSKLGGEISVSATESSPEIAFDFTLVELERQDGNWKIGRYGILEIQTMDYHGSYKHAVTDMRDAMRLHGKGFHKTLARNLRWLSKKVEGPNLANVFKRTFYQMMLKFHVGVSAHSVGCLLALPTSVWDSWQKHLGKPGLDVSSTGESRLSATTSTGLGAAPAWIMVFEPEVSERQSPNSLAIRKVIRTDADALAYHALVRAPHEALRRNDGSDPILNVIQRRLTDVWSELKAVNS